MEVGHKCDECGTEFVARRRDSRHCSPACRKRAQRRGRADANLQIDEVADRRGRGGSIELALVEELATIPDADALDVALARKLARQIDGGSMLESGSSLAAKARVFNEIVARIQRGAERVDDPVVELRRRRERRRGSVSPIKPSRSRKDKP